MKNLGTSAKMTHYYSDEWCADDRKRSQEELQIIAQNIRRGCSVDEIHTHDDGEACTIYINAALGIKYWIKDRCGWISEIDEARYYK